MLPYFLLVAGIVMLVLFLIARDKKSSVLAIIFKTATSLFFIATGLAAVVENGVVGGFESTASERTCRYGACARHGG